MAEESSEGLEASNTNTYASPQILSISPLDLYFPPPHNRELSCSIVMVNPTKDPVAFKVKTTAPKRYIVRPPQGLCPPGQKVEVTVALSYAKDPPTSNSQDKFQIQAFPVKNHLATTVSHQLGADELKALWASAPKNQVVKTKVRSFFTEEPTKHQSSVQSAVSQSEPAVNSPGPITTSTARPKSDDLGKITDQGYATKSRSSNVSVHSFENYLDPVSTPAPTKSSSLVPLILVSLVALLIGILAGMYLERLTAEGCADIAKVAKAAAEGAKAAATAGRPKQ